MCRARTAFFSSSDLWGEKGLQSYMYSWIERGSLEKSEDAPPLSNGVLLVFSSLSLSLFEEEFARVRGNGSGSGENILSSSRGFTPENIKTQHRLKRQSLRDALG